MRGRHELDRQRAVRSVVGRGGDRGGVLVDDASKRFGRALTDRAGGPADLERSRVGHEGRGFTSPRAGHERIPVATHDDGRGIHPGEYRLDPVRPPEAERCNDPRWAGQDQVTQVLEPDGRPFAQQAADGTNHLAEG